MDSKHSKALVSGIFCILTALSSHPAYGAPPSDPCALLTQAQVNAVLGIQVGPGRRVAPTLCEWALAGEAPSLRQKKVAVIIETEQGFAAAKTPVGHGTTKLPASGIGDEAVFGTTPKFVTNLTVKKGALYFSVCVYGFPLDQSKDVDQVQAKEKTLALEILSNM